MSTKPDPPAPTADKRPDVYDEPTDEHGDDYNLIIRASRLGACTQSLVRSWNGVTPELPPDVIQTAMDFGTDHEQEVIERLQAKHPRLPKEGGLEVWTPEMMLNRRDWPTITQIRWHDQSEQLECDLSATNLAVIRAHLDGAAAWDPMMITGKRQHNRHYRSGPMEIKCMAPGNDPMSRTEYRWQLAAQSIAWGGWKHPATVLLVIGWKNEARTKIEDIEVREVPFRDLDITVGQFKARVKRIERAINQFNTDGEMVECDVRMWPCGYYQYHDTTNETSIWFEGDNLDWTEDARGVRLMELGRQYKRAKLAEKQAKERAQELKAEIGELAGWNHKVVLREGWTVTTKSDVVPAATYERKAYTREEVRVNVPKGVEL